MVEIPQYQEQNEKGACENKRSHIFVSPQTKHRALLK